MTVFYLESPLIGSLEDSICEEPESLLRLVQHLKTNQH